MKSIKITLLVFLGTNLFAQLDYGIMAGATFPKIKFKAEGMSIEGKTLTAFTLGGFASYEVSDQVNIRSGLMYTGKGTGFNIPGEEGSTNPTLKISYLNVPVHAMYKLPVGGGFSDNYLQLFAGPYLGFALSAKATDGVIIEEIARPDLGFDVGAGFQYDKFMVNLTYSLGMANIISEADDGASATNQVISVTLGYLLKTSGF